MKLLVIGCILIVLGLALYFARGIGDALVLPVIGIVMLVGGIIYPYRAVKQKEAIVK